jgi:5,10-methenyltetrahydrofolate synthetase
MRCTLVENTRIRLMARPPDLPGGKQRLRREMLALRDAMSAAERARIAAILTERLLRLPEYGDARSVLATMSIGSEWSTQAFIEKARADGKAIVLPRISGSPKRLELHTVADLRNDLVPGVWNIPEPDPARCPRIAFDRVDFALVPALAVDREGFRLGYGAGYFDRLLAERKTRPWCVTALPHAFIVERLPHEPHDVAVDRVLDERGLLPAGVSLGT